ncbi:MAG: flavodoxin family protein [Thermotogota bacterium]
MVKSERTPRVLGVFGSPRLDGNSSTLLEEVLRAAEQRGAAVERAVLADKRIAPCRACDACLKAGVCVQHDDMQELVNRMVESDVWALATPVYWWGPSAQLKTFVDRWYGAWHNPAHRAAFAGKRAVLVASMGDSDPATARHVVGMFQDAFTYVGMTLTATVLAPNVSSRSDASKRPDLMDAARAAGREAVANL